MADVAVVAHSRKSLGGGPPLPAWRAGRREGEGAPPDVPVVTVAGVAAGTLASVLWFIRMLRRCGLQVRFGQA